MKRPRVQAAVLAGMLTVMPGVAYACGQTPDYNPTCGDSQGDCGISNGGGAEQNSQQTTTNTQPAQPATNDSPCPAGSWDAGSPHC